MSNSVNVPISDELLAAYLDGRLDQQQADFVEQAIENSPELQWTVDRWLDSQLGSFSKSVANTFPVSSKPISKPIWRFWPVAASVLVLVAVSIPLFFNSFNVSSDSGLPMDFPVSQCGQSSSLSLPAPTPSTNASAGALVRFPYNFEIYKTAAIVSWSHPLDSASCVASSSDSQRVFTTTSTSSRVKSGNVLVIPLNFFLPSQFPLTLSLHFYGHDFVSSDTILVNQSMND